MPGTISVFIIVFTVFSGGYAFAGSADTSQGPVEVVAAGKRYPSVHAYKLQQFKDNLRGVLSPGQLREFSEEEISAIIREIQAQPPVMAHLPAPEATAPMTDTQIGQMEEMLMDYRAEHPDAPSLEVDSGKIKTVIIKPSSSGQE